MNSICEQLVTENGSGWVYVFLRIELIATMESYRDAPNPRIRVATRIDPPAPRDPHCTEPHLVGCPAHARIGEVTLHDRGRAICGADRLGSSRSVSRLGKCLPRNHREPSCGADYIVRFAHPTCSCCHRPVAVGKCRKASLRHPASLARCGSGLSDRGRDLSLAVG